MDFWYRLETLVRSWLRSYDAEAASDRHAWRELEEFLNDKQFDRLNSRPRSAGGRARSSSGNVPPDVRRALSDLELSPGAGIEEIRRAYRAQLLRYHPDRHASDAERYRTAEEVTRRLTLAYTRLKAYYD